jgi:hypothetical protein
MQINNFVESVSERPAFLNERSALPAESFICNFYQLLGEEVWATLNKDAHIMDAP